MKKILMIISFLFYLQIILYSQKDKETISIGEYRLIKSEILNEDRRILVHLPLGYEDTDLKYPVIYHLYGDFVMTYFTEAATKIERLHDAGKMPQAILIGVDNTERYRDLRPLDRNGNPGGIENFFRYFEDELMPFVKNNYRVEDFNILVGPQAGACFGLCALMERTDLFDAFILENSFLNPQPVNEFLVNKAGEFFKNSNSLNKFLFLKIQNESSNMQNALAQKSIIENSNCENFKFHFQMDDETYYNPPEINIESGLKKLFAGYDIHEHNNITGLNDIKNYYQQYSEKAGFQVNVSDRILRKLANNANKTGNTQLVKQIWEYVLNLYPKSLDGLFNMAEISFAAKNYSDARKYYESFLEIRPNESFIRYRLNSVLELINKSKVN